MSELTTKERLCVRFAPISGWFRRNFSGTAPAIYTAASLVAAVVIGVSAIDTYFPGVLGYTLASAVVWLLLLAAGALVGKLCRKFLGHSLICPISAALLAAALYELIRRGGRGNDTFHIVLVTAGLFAAVWLLAVSVWSVFRFGRKTPTALLCLLLALCGSGAAGVFLFTDGFDDHYIARYLALRNDKDARVAAFTDSLAMGDHAVLTVDYGTESGLDSRRVNLGTYANRENADFNGTYADYYLDYELSNVPLVGRVWYPEGGKNCPVMFIAHGNHEIVVDSYLGYDYLGEYLASHGYAVVSVDHNACNLLKGENDARAILMLEHIEQLLHYNGEKGNPLFGVLDAENIALAGHSRGGEMVATACLFNNYDRYPENGAVRFDYDFSIRSLIAIAPTVNQYKPADHSVELEDVNYLLLHGACDRDVSNFMGMTQYENISFSGEGDFLKSALYIAGANHGQFNSLWGAYDQAAPFGTLLNVESLMPEKEQQTAAALFIKTFLDVTLRGDDSCRTLLTDWDDYAAQLPKTVYMQCSETSGFFPIADFEEDSDLESASMEGVQLNAKGTSIWTEELMDFSNDTSFDTYALRLKWRTGNGLYTIALPETDASRYDFTFDIADLDDESVEKKAYALTDCEIVLTDSEGREAAARLSDHATVYPVLPVRTDKLDYLFRENTYRHAFSTVTVPVTAFAGKDGFDTTRITQITFRFDGAGEIALDNIGWIVE